MPLQKGFVSDRPQRQSAITSFVGRASPFEFVRRSRFLTRYGPFGSGSMTMLVSCAVEAAVNSSSRGRPSRS